MESEQNYTKKIRQAIVIIHGIGEQRPMDTLRNFVEALLKGDNQNKEGTKGQPYHSKPDTISNSYELRRIKLRKYDGSQGDKVNPDWKHKSDFYEYYWAHHMSGTEWKHIFAWMIQIFGKRRRNYKKEKKSKNDTKHHKRLKYLYPSVEGAMIFCLIIIMTILIHFPSAFVFVIASGLTAIPLVVYLKKLFNYVFRLKGTTVVGDAARYLDIAPTNVARRYEILKGGIAMLRSLHEERRRYNEDDEVNYTYDRIIVVGHSLGSIIAYDILKHYWAQVNGSVFVPKEPPKMLKEIEEFYCQKRDINDFVNAQYGLWREFNNTWEPLKQKEHEGYTSPPPRWIITDLITLGSPLSYGALLMADSVSEFEKKTKLRELPICPPDLSRHVNPKHFYIPLKEEADVDDYFEDKYILHHGAMFAITRWTNFYFPKDLIAGKVSNVFGPGIRDIKLCEDKNCWWNAHTSYWAPESKQSLDKMRKILMDIQWSSISDLDAKKTNELFTSDH